MAPEIDRPPALLRAVSRWEIVALALNDVVGSGVYLVLPVATARLLGPASIWAIVLVGIAILPVTLCFAEASSLFDVPGGAYVYARVAFGELVGFEIGWLSWIARVSAISGLLVYLARAVGYLWSGAQRGTGQWSVIFGALALLTAINVLGVKVGARTAVVLAIAKLLPLFTLVAVGLFTVEWKRVFAAPVPPPGAMSQAALLVLFAYGGFENTPAPAGEYRNPKRDVPFALVVQLVLVVAVYALVQLVAVGTVPDLGASQTPLAEAGQLLLGPAGGLLLTVGAIASVLGTSNNTVLTGPRYLYAVADGGGLPRVFARVHPRFHTPAVAIVTQSALAGLLLLSGTAEDLAELSAISRVMTYAGTCLAVPFLRRKLAQRPEALRLPGGPAVPAVAAVVCLAFVYAATWKNWIAAAIAIAVGAAAYFASRRRV